MTLITIKAIMTMRSLYDNVFGKGHPMTIMAIMIKAFCDNACVESYVDEVIFWHCLC